MDSEKTSVCEQPLLLEPRSVEKHLRQQIQRHWTTLNTRTLTASRSNYLN